MSALYRMEQKLNDLNLWMATLGKVLTTKGIVTNEEFEKAVEEILNEAKKVKDESKSV